MELKILENKCPYCKEALYVNKKTFANHVRWCIENPNREEMLRSMRSKLCVERVPRNEHIIKCEYCGNEYSITCTDNDFLKGNYKKTCSDLCSKRLTAKKGGTEKKANISKSLRKYYKSTKKNYCEEDGCYLKICPNCGKEYKTNKKQQIYCSRDCANKEQSKKTKDGKETFLIYKKQCAFKFSISKVITDEGLKLLKDNGWYKAKNHGDNMKGVSRDHMYSIKEGFKNRVDPYYISHPANCSIILQSKNASKRDKCCITKEELLCRIREWEKQNGHYDNTIFYYGIEDFKEIQQAKLPTR